MNAMDRVPLYQKIQDYIRSLISSNGLKEGDRIPTEKELMERFNVSKITVVNALTGLANENVITRVPGRGSFVSGQAGEAVAAETRPTAVSNATVRHEPVTQASTKSGIIGLILPSIYDYFAARLTQGVQNALMEKGYRTVIMLSNSVLSVENEAIQTLMEMGAEGMLIFPVDEEQYNVEILGMKLSNYPFILIDRYLPGVETHYIAGDGRAGAELAVDHLWELGHREIAICSDSPIQTVTVQERIQGYMDALKKKGALINPAHIITEFSPVSEVEEKHPLYRYIRNRMATAYITLNSKLGMQVYRAARQCGLSVPDDLSIVSFDDPTSIAEDMSIFTHVKQFEYEIGYKAANKLIEVINDKQASEHKYSKMIMKPELVVRQSTGPLKSNDK
ncbi:GntR family transcriptional regulator of arabinose operon [Paenibacillus taihuensis]|uniref:GntR family transcriptional regulator of arabinose operon n=1 Tax=Paenibacillus taihuensis TaxID=1156355 RepID=A0A3D9RM31_9BACL|nr:GntR family transcriptional regulator [Paenibacillus taihuensis]REE80959.1 GntR family transcriptional regulator of arabinose operon [Paenibacillus taihuensis]